MKVEKKFLIPVKGHRVRKETDPTLFVKPTGELLPMTVYYKRRIRRVELTVRKTKKQSVPKEEKG